ncbi:hypothetical protein RDI58_026255 [Solanum bulbocastanum]|uniref:Glycosyl transferase family 1 domain-containing protein n=1 Tax=Solanum bulbocastanum TaxID=147425 RepID=A0AAN8Y0Z1_SOLBU
MTMGRSSGDDNKDKNDNNAISSGGGFHSIRDRFRFKRNSQRPTETVTLPSSSSSPDRQWKTPARSHHHHHHNRSFSRKLIFFCFRGKWLYLCIFLVIFVFALASMVLQSSIMSVFRQNERARWRWPVRDDLKLGSSLKFVQPRRFQLGNGLDLVRNQSRIGVRPPRIALVLGNMRKDPLSLMLSTVVKNLRGLGYMIKIYAVEDGIARSIWEEIGGKVSILTADRYDLIDWSIFDGVIADSLEDKNAIASLMQEPFCSVPLVWIIQQDTLASRLHLYENMGWENLISHWRDSFRRADVIVFPDYSLPMLYSGLDTGNFFVISGSPKDNWAAGSYSRRHSKSQSREKYGFGKDDLLVLVFGSSTLYNELSWDYALSIRHIEPLLLKFAGSDVEERLKFVFMSGNSSDGYNDALQDIATRLGLHEGSLSHYDMKGDVNSITLIADIVLYFSPQYEQEFPPILIRAMSFGIPIVAPDYPVIKKYVVDEVHGIIFSQHNSNELVQDFSLLISDGKLTRFAHTIASSGMLLSKNMFAVECITGYAKLLENVITFPSDVILPGDTSQLKQDSWEWGYFQKDLEDPKGVEDLQMKDVDPINSSVVYDLELEMTGFVPLNVSRDDPEAIKEDFPSELDWDILNEMERSEEVDRLESEEIEERMEKDIGKWDDIYRNARKSEKLRFETNERDEGELERTGQPICIYEVYDGTGAWSFLHHGSLYRGLSLSTKARRLRSDDVDAVGRLTLLNETYYRDILCEMGGMFSIANHLDNIHRRPWIGFQSWQATGRKVSLSKNAELALEETIQAKVKGDVIYYWAHLDVDGGFTGNNDALTFWSRCDILNGGNCRNAFQDAFRIMYGLPSHIEALPPMPEDGGKWSALHSWVMPTSSFLEFIMFSRIFVDALDGLHVNSSNRTHCILANSTMEKQHCYCRVLELLVNVWAYHSARQMVYINPHSGAVEEQHSVEQRKGYMWAKYFNMTLLKSMDEDMAEAADDNYHPYETWLWPLTGEIYWQGIYEREREERYRQKMDKKRKTREKLQDRMKHGYKQKSLGG